MNTIVFLRAILWTYYYSNIIAEKSGIESLLQEQITIRRYDKKLNVTKDLDDMSKSFH